MRLARDHAHLLRVAMQTFSRQSSTVLTTSLRVVSTVGTPVIEEFSYDEYLTGLPEQAVCAVLSLEPWAGRSLLTLDAPTLLTVVDCRANLCMATRSRCAWSRASRTGRLKS